MDILNEITAIEAWELLNSNEFSALIDVRTKEEIISSGSPQLKGKVFRIESHEGSSFTSNPLFAEQLTSLFPDKNMHLIFICRTNGRSKIAKEIAEKLWYKNCYIVMDGYLGTNFGKGWIASKLPYENFE